MEFTSKKLTRFPILKQYYYSCKAGEINYDPRQVRILKDFENFAKKLNSFSFRRKKYPTGIYIFGSVGIGKTYLSGILYDNIKMPKKRIHLHEFMYLVYDLLNEFRKTAKANQDPLVLVAKKISKQYKFIFFDEFLIHDPADAFIMHKLFKALIKQKVRFIITSNFQPNELYKDGLKRDQFLAFIDLLHHDFKVMNLDVNCDYRRKKIASLRRTYLAPINAENDKEFDEVFHDLTANSEVSDHTLFNKSREIYIPYSASKTALFDFEDLCEKPLGSKDYQIIAENYTTIFIKNINEIDENHNELARRFINMIDVFYNQKINVIFYADIDCENLYTGSKLEFEFSRAISRIKAMQTADYQNFDN